MRGKYPDSVFTLTAPVAQRVTQIPSPRKLPRYRLFLNHHNVPLLGFDFGVEVAPLLGKSRGLDWTGVLLAWQTDETLNGNTIAELIRQLEEARGELAHYRRLSEESGSRRLRESEELSCLVADLRRSRLELQKARDDLEKRVQDRTAALTDANQRLEQEMIERHKIEMDLRKSESGYRLLAENVNDIIWTMNLRVNMRLTYCSPRSSE